MDLKHIKADLKRLPGLILIAMLLLHVGPFAQMSPNASRVQYWIIFALFFVFIAFDVMRWVRHFEKESK